MQAQDDLAALFSRNLTFNPEIQSHVQPPKAEEELKQAPDPAPTNAAPTPAPIIYSITQHYTHSAHVARQPQSQDVPVQHPALPNLRRTHQLRLIEIWRAAPPNSSTENPSLAWTSTTLEQEEQLAKLRYERMEAEKEQRQQNAVMSLDGTPVQSDDSRWLANSISHQVEPYMMSGYEEMMRREYEREQVEARSSSNYSHYGSVSGYKPATDPVYKGFGDDWAREQAIQMQMQMENQYGAFQHFGGQAGNMEAMEIL
ncbi:hypothetical protein Ct61P_07218 [Colletotrichum tofieldiae]|nr:hypothetical protein Ct61P_07218 [Colletotrichum tofieldiae]